MIEPLPLRKLDRDGTRPAPKGDMQGHFLAALTAAGDCAYEWDIHGDGLEWSGNASDILGLPAAELPASGRAFASLLDPGNVTSRFETVMRSTVADTGQGVSFRVEYLLRPHGRGTSDSLWVEDQGRWFAGSDGRPARVLGVLRRIDERQKREKSLRDLGNFDPLTGMMNRGRFSEALGEAIATARAKAANCGLLLISISNLESVNDAYGFEVAEEVIIAIARRLRHVQRHGDTIGRYSGSKFGVLLPGCGEENLSLVAERFLTAARDCMIDTARGPVWAMLSIGGLLLPDQGSTPSQALAHAEEALKEARNTLTDRAVFYRADESRESERALNAKAGADIVDALKADAFALAFQPIVEAKTRELAMHEVLLRLRHANGVMVSAAHLVPVAERLGLIRLVDDKVAGLALEALAAQPDSHLTFNVSGITAADPRWTSQIISRINAHGSAIASRLMIEITETAALNDIATIRAFIDRLKGLGCRVAIDDFGAGYTSFRNLSNLNVDLVKLDGSFCTRLSENAENQFFVRTLLDLARKAGLKTIAEWVETEADAALLTEWGADYLQGYLFGRAAEDPNAEPRVPKPASKCVTEEAPASLMQLGHGRRRNDSSEGGSSQP